MKLSELSQEEKFSRVLPSINTEFKNITWYCLDDRWKTYIDLEKEFKKNIDEESAILLNAPTFGGYCHNTFLPIGLVAEEKIKLKGRTNPVLHWKLTEDGEKYKPIAVYAIKTANDFGLSMYQILGSTATHGRSRAPWNRAKILMELAEEENLRVTDLATKIDLHPRGIGYHLSALKEIDFVEYEYLSLEESGWSKYEWIKGEPEEVKPVSTIPTLTKKVSEFLYESDKPLDYKEVTKELDYKYPSVISKILSGIEKQGFCKRVKFNKFLPKRGEKLSEANITELGMKFVQEFLEPVYNTLEDDNILEDMRSVLEEYENDAMLSINHFTRANLLYKEVCPSFKRKLKEFIKTDILDFLEEKGKLRKKEINALVRKNVGKHLKELLEESKIEKERDGMAVYYRIKS